MINIEKKDKIDIISFNIKKIDAMITDEIKERVSKVFENANSKAIIDLKGVEYIDSSGFGCFLSVFRIAKNNYGSLKFANPEPRIMELFNILHLHLILQIYDNLDECIRSYR